MKTVKKIFLFMLISSSVLGQQQKPLPKSVVDDYAYSAYSQFRYGQNAAFASLIYSRLLSKGYSRTDIAVGMESLKTNVSFREATFEALFWHGSNEDYLFANLEGMGMKATNAKILTDYIRHKFLLKEVEQRKVDEAENRKAAAANRSSANEEYQQLKSSFISGEREFTGEVIDLKRAIIGFQSLNLPSEIRLVEKAQIQYKADSLLAFLGNYFKNERIYLHVSKAGELLYVSDEADVKKVTTSTFPILKRWISVTGAYKVNIENKLQPVAYKFPALSLVRIECATQHYYYFHIGRQDLELLKDSTTFKNHALRTVRQINNGCPPVFHFTYDQNNVQQKVFSYTGSKSLKDLRKITNTQSSVASDWVKVGLTAATGVPLVLADKEKNENLFRFLVKNNIDKTALFDVGITEPLKVIDNTSDKANYELQVYKSDRRDFMTLKLK